MKDKEQFKHSILEKKERYIADRKLKYKKRLLIMAPIVTCLIVCFAVLVFPLIDIPFHPIEISGDFSQNIGSEPKDIKSVNLMKSISPGKVTGKTISPSFISSTANFSVDLFQKTVSQNENCLVSPLSVMLALSMTANGADGNTLTQMEQVLGGNLSIGDLNQYFGLYIGNLPNHDKAKLSIANSIWFRNGLPVNKNFLQTNANYYGASAYQSAFDNQTVSDINQWVNTKTDGMIDSILDRIGPNTRMYLINAITFDAEWQDIYKSDHISEGMFTAADGTEQKVKYMGSSENLYLNDGKATGFIKPYAGDNYSFVALLPNENVSINDYIASLSGDGFIKTIENAETVDNTQEMGVRAQLPIFSYSYDIELKDSLQALGMTDAFSEGLANFHKITEDETELFISRVIHKTFISVDTKGTKAGAVTAVEQTQKSAIMIPEKTVFLNRPFVYAIIDNSTNIPIFMGTVMNFPK